MSLPPLWPHQEAALAQVKTHIAAGVQSLLLVSPTGGGKSRMAGELIRHCHEEEAWPCVVYTNRKMLVDQLEKNLKEFGLHVGVRAAGRADHRERSIQVSSIQTEYSRCFRKKDYLKWELHGAKLVFVDEAHLQGGKMAATIVDAHLAAGAHIVLLTATPLDLTLKADVLVQAGTNSQLRDCGALVAAHHYAPDEPDLRCIKKDTASVDDLTEGEQRSLMGKVGEDGAAEVKLQRLFGRVIEHYLRLNPEQAPTILFAPGVPESKWFAQQFTDAGIPAAHIDGEDIWVPGGTVKSDKAARDELAALSKGGQVKVICNRFVLREGVDWPWLAHGIFATAFGSLQTYLQSAGRLLRGFPGLPFVTVQDHGGNWWRHGSMNEDRVWKIGDQSKLLAYERAERLRNKDKTGAKEPFVCPNCRLLMTSLRCTCGFKIDPTHKTRPVIMDNGDLILMRGDVFKPRKEERREDTQALWDKCYYRCKQKGLTFTQARGLFYQEYRYWPPADLLNMPRTAADWMRKVAGVLPKDLNDQGEHDEGGPVR